MSSSASNDLASKLVYGPPPKRSRRLEELPDLNKNPNPDSTSSSRRRPALLSYDLVEYIFTLLPITYAVQAGLVAKRFQHSWRLGRRLHFDKDLALKYSEVQFYAIINHVFDAHYGREIRSFGVHINAKDNEFILEKWVQRCVEMGVEELHLNICNAHNQPLFDVTSTFVAVESMRVLKLSHSIFNLPLAFNGLPIFLTTLVLRGVKISPLVIQTIFDTCMLLETLDMGRCHGFLYLRIQARKQRSFRVLKVGACDVEFRGIEIDAPSLRSLYYQGYIHQFTLITSETPFLLNEASLDFKPFDSSKSGLPNPLQAVELVSSICYVEVLTITSTFLEGLCAKISPLGYFVETQYSLWNLKEVHLIMENPSFCNLGDIVAFLKNCPSLEILFIDVANFTFGGGCYWELVQGPLLLGDDFGSFKNLKFIKIKGFKFEPRYINLVKFLLRKSMELESMFLIFHKSFHLTAALRDDMPLFHDVFLSWRLSKKAGVYLNYHWDDKSNVCPRQARNWYNEEF